MFCDEKQNKLFLNAFWPNIELEFLQNDTFKLAKFPLQLQFVDDKIMFTGDLIWDMKGKYFTKTKAKTLKK